MNFLVLRDNPLRIDLSSLAASASGQSGVELAFK